MWTYFVTGTLTACDYVLDVLRLTNIKHCTVYLSIPMRDERRIELILFKIVIAESTGIDGARTM